MWEWCRCVIGCAKLTLRDADDEVWVNLSVFKKSGRGLGLYTHRALTSLAPIAPSHRDATDIEGEAWASKRELAVEKGDGRRRPSDIAEKARDTGQNTHPGASRKASHIHTVTSHLLHDWPGDGSSFHLLGG